MPGPPPKNPNLRQRRNKSSSRALLPNKPKRQLRKPQLPKLEKGEVWHPFAVKFWETIWASPMSAEFVHGDEPALLRLLFLTDRYWKGGSLEVAKEIRMMEQQFGLTPLSRRRLEWTVAQAEDAKDRHEENRSKHAKKYLDIEPVDDPRGVLDE